MFQNKILPIIFSTEAAIFYYLVYKPTATRRLRQSHLVWQTDIAGAHRRSPPVAPGITGGPIRCGLRQSHLVRLAESVKSQLFTDWVGLSSKVIVGNFVVWVNETFVRAKLLGVFQAPPSGWEQQRHILTLSTWAWGKQHIRHLTTSGTVEIRRDIITSWVQALWSKG